MAKNQIEIVSLDELRDAELDGDSIPPEIDDLQDDELNAIRIQSQYSADGHSWNGRRMVNFIYD